MFVDLEWRSFRFFSVLNLSLNSLFRRIPLLNSFVSWFYAAQSPFIECFFEAALPFTAFAFSVPRLSQRDKLSAFSPNEFQHSLPGILDLRTLVAGGSNVAVHVFRPVSSVGRIFFSPVGCLICRASMVVFSF